jgi:hypothetical protein
LYEQLSHDMIRDLVGSDSLVFKPREFLAAVDEDINVGIGRFQMNTGQIGVGRIVLVQDREDPPVRLAPIRQSGIESQSKRQPQSRR